MRHFLSCLAIFCGMYVLPTVAYVHFAERAEAMGHTDLSRAEAWDAVHPGDNYSVFRKGRYIYIITGLAPRMIMERDGEIVRVDTVLNKLLPVRTYSPATPAERALWNKYFS